MSPPNNDKPPLVEPSAASDDLGKSDRALRLRIRQQSIFAELGVSALQGASLAQLLSDTARLTAEGLQADFCKVLEYFRPRIASL